MPQQIVTEGIVLSRIDYGEADRILTVLTSSNGKISLLAKGVRKIKSKLAGGVELLSVSQLTFMPGRGEIGTLVSARLKVHYGSIVNDLDRTMLAYELLKRTNRATEDEPGSEYFYLLQKALESLDENTDLRLVELWFDARLLKLAGHQPNLSTDIKGKKLSAEETYVFDPEAMGFIKSENGQFDAQHIKFLRLAFGVDSPKLLQQVTDAGKVLNSCFQLVSTARKQFIRL